MVKISRFTRIPDEGGFSTFTFELDAPAANTVTTAGFYFSFFIKIGHLVEFDQIVAPIQRIQLECESGNLSIMKVQCLAGGDRSLGMTRLLGGVATASDTADTCFAGIYSTGNIDDASSQKFRDWSTADVYVHSAAHLPSNRWLHIVARKNRTTPGGLKFSGTDIGLDTTGKDNGIFTPTPQTGAKIRLTVRGHDVHSVHLSNIWCALEPTEIPDFDDIEYISNFVDDHAKEIDGDGTVGAIAPIFYFKGDDDNPVKDTVSGLEATHNAGFVELYEKHVLISLKTRRPAIDTHTGGVPWNSPLYSRPSGLLVRADFPGDRDPLFAFTIAEARAATDLSRADNVFGYIAKVGSDWAFVARTRGGFAYTRSYEFLRTASATISNTAGARHHTIVRATSASVGDVYMIINNQSKELTRRSDTSDVPVNFRYYSRRRQSLAILYTASIMDANSQIDWFAEDATELTDSFVDRQTRKARDGGLFGKGFLGVTPAAYNNSKLRFIVGVGAIIATGSGTTQTAPPRTNAIPEESRTEDEYGFDFFGNDYQD